MQHFFSWLRSPLERYGAPLLILFASSASHGGDMASVPAPSSAPAAAPNQAVVQSKSPFKVQAVSQRLLANSRAGSATAVVTETGSLQQTTATNVQTGTNAIVGGSFANALGLTTVIQNSGANVLIQNATTINVQFK